MKDFRSQIEPGWQRIAAIAVLCLVAICASGCSEELETHYGQRSGPGVSSSVNGTAVLADMFEQAGHHVSAWYSLSPRLEREDCIVWFPDDFQPPSREVREWLEQWLDWSPDRTLIYVGRDFDAATWYWRKVGQGAPDGQRQLVHDRQQAAELSFGLARLRIPEWEDCDWFVAEGEDQPRKVRSLQGERRWCAAVEPNDLEIELSGRIEPSLGTEVVLESEGSMLVGRKRFGDGRLIVVANGSFLVNAALVNREHRKLAGALIAEVGPPGRKVVFLESGRDGPPIRRQDPAAGVPTGLEIFHVWPTNWILLHLAAAGIIYCFSRFPIFGRPRPPEPPGRSDFGKHVQAVADLLQQSQDREYAMSRVLHYQQTVKRSE